MMWGIVPAAGSGTRIQPLAFSKELLPVGSRCEDGLERPRAVSEHLIERMTRAGVDRICFVISPTKSDILRYYGSRFGPAHLVYAVQPEPRGLCDAIFHAVPLVAPAETVLIGLPDTIWFPDDGFLALPGDRLAMLLFRVDRPELFDAVVTAADGRVLEVQVKRPEPASFWVWGAFKMPGSVLHDLYRLWCERQQQDEYLGTLINAYIERGGQAYGIRAGQAYVDVGTLNGYREALRLLAGDPAGGQPDETAVVAMAAAAAGDD
jgi:glucose-1-phosphate thymidylyltransferase